MKDKTLILLSLSLLTLLCIFAQTSQAGQMLSERNKVLIFVEGTVIKMPELKNDPECEKNKDIVRVQIPKELNE